MKNILLNRKFILFFLIFLILCFIPMISYGIDISGIGDLDDYGKVTTSSSVFEDKVGTILAVVQVIGSLFAVISWIAMGIKYMLGSIEEKAQYKKTLLPYFIGSILVFGISNILNVVYQLAINLT